MKCASQDKNCGSKHDASDHIPGVHKVMLSSRE